MAVTSRLPHYLCPRRRLFRPSEHVHPFELLVLLFLVFKQILLQLGEASGPSCTKLPGQGGTLRAQGEQDAKELTSSCRLRREKAHALIMTQSLHLRAVAPTLSILTYPPDKLRLKWHFLKQ